MSSGKVAAVDVLGSTASDLQTLLEEGKTTSHALVEAYLAQIDRHNKQGLHLNSVVTVVPSSVALAIADSLDEERRAGTIRGPLHGIPIIDAITTGPTFKVPTTLGACAFGNAMSKADAEVVRLLRDHGLIIIGKASMTQFLGVKGTNVTVGWSPLSGQTQSAFVEGGVRDDLIFGHSTPGGSSSGSGVSVSAGFSPLALGTETDGSIMGPAHRAGLFALKPHAGSVPMAGTYALTEWDSVGALAKSAEDLTDLVNIIIVPSPGFDTAEMKKTTWEGLKIGFVDPELWRLPESICARDDQIRSEFDDAFRVVRERIQSSGAKVEYPVTLPAVGSLSYEGKGGIGILINQEMKSRISDFSSWIENPDIRTLDEVIEFNKANAEREMPTDKPDQASLISALEDHHTPAYAHSAAVAVQQLAREGLDKVLKDHEIDVIVAPGDSPVTALATCAGYPVAAVPIGTLSIYGRPHGLSLLAKKSEESKLLEFMHAFEKTFPKRPLPPRLLQEMASL